MDDRHRGTPICLGCFCRDLSRHLARAYCRPRPSIGKQSQHGSTCNVDPHFRLRPDVMTSGFRGGFHPGGQTGRCRLVPSPMTPGCWRAKSDVSACAASAALAPPRIRLMRSRRRRASSKSRALAAASILRCRTSMVSVITLQTHGGDFWQHCDPRRSWANAVRCPVPGRLSEHAADTLIFNILVSARYSISCRHQKSCCGQVDARQQTFAFL